MSDQQPTTETLAKALESGTATDAEYLLAAQRLRDLEQWQVEIRAHGCLTGDCPHMNVQNCLNALMEAIGE